VRIVRAWLRLDVRRRWGSLAVLAMLVALASGTVLTALAGARRGASAVERLKDRTLPATAAILANTPNFDWGNVRTLPGVDALGYFGPAFPFGAAAFLAALFLVGRAVARSSAAATAELQPLRAVGMSTAQSVAAAAAAPAVAGVFGGVLGVAAAVVASRWFPIGLAQRAEPSPGTSADWLVLGPGLAAAALLVVAGAAAAAWLALGTSRRPPSGRRSVVAAAVTRAGLPVPVVVGTRFALEPGRGRTAVPVRPALVGAVVGVLGLLAALTFARGVADVAGHPEKFGQTYQLTAMAGDGVRRWGRPTGC